jgi:hypothetical protein
MPADFSNAIFTTVGSLRSVTTHMNYGSEFTHDQSGASSSRLNTDQQFIELCRNFEVSLRNSHLFENNNVFQLKERMKYCADALLNYEPDTITLQVTSEKGLFFTMRKNLFTVYFQYFPVEEFDNSSEAQVSIFNGEENLFNFDGTLTGALKIVSKYLASKRSMPLEYA